MGSIGNATIPGFLCRICMKVHRSVILLFGHQGQRMQLIEKLEKYLFVTISPTDNLPKSICQDCIKKLRSAEKNLLRMQKLILEIHPEWKEEGGDESLEPISDDSSESSCSDISISTDSSEESDSFDFPPLDLSGRPRENEILPPVSESDDDQP
ncbi:uncharacterized protein LOC108047094 [Drosophila rhopaloa]|uniref:Uncharacterized protein LOC108047094 n=1 Tax=Drosophila rhopaloa TaxID=1041015 RepID=A0A6P4F0T5_DRORH|nr:uncharacterized protein LOC108047094 [Drosophila rhopaloa]